MYWIRRLLPLFCSSLLFALVGMPLGAVVFLAGFGIAAGKLLAGFEILAQPGAAAQLTAMLGAVPAIVTGAVAVPMRARVRSFWGYLVAMALSGVIVTAIYQGVLFFLIYGVGRSPEVTIIIGGIAATGGLCALSCSVLFCRKLASCVRPAPR